MFESKRKWIEEGFFLRDLFSTALSLLGLPLPTALVMWGTINDYGWGPALLAGMVAFGTSLWILSHLLKMKNERHLKGSLRWGEIHFKSNGIHFRLYVAVNNICAQARFFQVQEIQGSTQCNPRKWETLTEKWSSVLEVYPGGKEEITISQLPLNLVKIKDGEKRFGMPIGHRHYRVKLRVGRSEDNLESGMICEFVANPPVLLQFDNGGHHLTEGGGDLNGARFNPLPISDWPAGFGSTCEESIA